MKTIQIRFEEDWEAEYYETHLKRFVDTLKLLNLNEAVKILDVGGGTGLFAAMIKERYGKLFLDQKHQVNIYALEIDPTKAALAIKRGINSIICDVEKGAFPFSNEFFDVVICTELIEHLSNPIPMLFEINRVLARKGYMLLSTPNSVGLFSRYQHLRGNSPHFIPFLSYAGSKGPFGVHRYEYTLPQIQELLKITNFFIEETRYSRFNHQRRGFLVKVIERLSLLRPSLSDMFIIRAKPVKTSDNF